MDGLPDIGNLKSVPDDGSANLDDGTAPTVE